MEKQLQLFLQKLKKEHPAYFNGKKVLEAGGPSGHALRGYFTNGTYTVQHGPHTTPVYRLDAPGAFDVIVHAGTLHYDRHWINTLCAMYRNLAPGGALIITCAGPLTLLYEDDDTPANYNPLGMDEVAALLPASAFTFYNIGYCGKTKNLEFFGVKK